MGNSRGNYRGNYLIKVITTDILYTFKLEASTITPRHTKPKTKIHGTHSESKQDQLTRSIDSLINSPYVGASSGKEGV